MKRVCNIGLVIISLLLFPVGSMAASNKCEVVEIEGTKLILECERDNRELAVGDQVKLKSVRKKTAPVEGC